MHLEVELHGWLWLVLYTTSTISFFFLQSTISYSSIHQLFIFGWFVST